MKRSASGVVYHPTMLLASYLINLGYVFMPSHLTSKFPDCCFLIALDNKNLVGISEYESIDMMKYMPRIDTPASAEEFLYPVRGKLLEEKMGI